MTEALLRRLLMIVNVQQEKVLIEVCFLAAGQDQSDVAARWGEGKVFALPICCENYISPSQDNLGGSHLALQLASHVVESGLWAPPSPFQSGAQEAALARRPLGDEADVSPEPPLEASPADLAVR